MYIFFFKYILEATNMDDLFYNDLVYAIRKIAGLEYVVDKNVENRIETRMKDVEVIDEVIGCFELSSFEEELFQFTRDISNEVGIKFRSFNDISMYPALVEEKLGEYEFFKRNHIDVKIKSIK